MGYSLQRNNNKRLPKKKVYRLTESDMVFLSRFEKFISMVKESIVDDEEQQTSLTQEVQFLQQDLSIKECQAVLNGWGEYNRTQKEDQLDLCLRQVTERVKSGHIFS